MGPQVLVADDAPTVCPQPGKSLRVDGSRVTSTHEGVEPLRALDPITPPRLVLLDRVMPGSDGQEVSPRLRGDGEGGVRAWLHEVADAGGSGELVVRSRDMVGHIVLHHGKVAWIHLGGGVALVPLLVSLGVTEHDARLTFEHCRRHGLPFLDTLVSRGLVDHPALEERLGDELSSRLSVLLRLPSCVVSFLPLSSPLRSLFLYDPSGLERDSSFPPSAIEPVARRSLSLVTPALPPGLEELLDGLTGLDGVMSVVVSELSSGQCLASRGQPCDESLRREMARPFLLHAGEPLEESFLASQTHYHLARTWSDHHLVYLRVDRRQNSNLALVRLGLSRCLEQVSTAT